LAGHRAHWQLVRAPCVPGRLPQYAIAERLRQSWSRTAFRNHVSLVRFRFLLVSIFLHRRKPRRAAMLVAQLQFAGGRLLSEKRVSERGCLFPTKRTAQFVNTYSGVSNLSGSGFGGGHAVFSDSSSSERACDISANVHGILYFAVCMLQQ